MLKYDDFLNEIGDFGPYQKLVYLLVCLPSIASGIHAVISIFITAVPSHRCAIPGFESDTYAIQNDFHANLINTTIPGHTEEGRYVYDECHIFANNSNHVTGVDTETLLCDRWVYDRTIFESTVVVTMNLVCSHKLYRSHVTMVFMAGKLVGSLVLGLLSDIFGRKLMLFLGIILQLLSGLATGFCTHYTLLALMRFINGVAATSIILNGFTIGVELVGPSKRKWTGMSIMYFFAFGEVILAGVAYLITDWKYLQIAVSIPSAVCLSFWWIVPESPRWLLAKGRDKEALMIIERIAKSNKTTVPQFVYKAEESNSGADTFLPVQEANTDRPWHLFTSVVLAKRTIIIFTQWMVVALTYYGLALNSGHLSGSIYLNFFLSCLVEFPAYTLCILFMDRLGRKMLHFIMMILSGVACLCTIFTVLYAGPDLQWITIILSLIGKLGSSAAFGLIYVFSAELFPTSLRNCGMGMSSTTARFGAMLAPYIADLGVMIGGELETALPLVIFGTVSVGAGLLSLTLPETLHRELPDNREDSKRFGRKKDPSLEEEDTF